MSKALVLVDIQNDFVSGTLAVPDARAIIPVANCMLRAFPYAYATKDWHPLNHCSFKQWPVHCLQNSWGSLMVRGIDIEYLQGIVFKGTAIDVDSYSGFIDNDGRTETVLQQFLKEKKVTDVYVCGLATDYCVKATALDARKRGYATHLITDACRGVHKQTTDEALADMYKAGVKFVTSQEIAKSILEK